MEFPALSRSPLFRGASPEEVETMLGCLGAERRRYARGACLCRAGETISALGLVLSGSVLVENTDFWGNTTVLERVGPGHVFAETYACIPGQQLMVSVVADEATEVLYLNVERVLRTCPNACSHHSLLIHNLLLLTARKNLMLSRKIFHTSPRSIRARLLSYLSDRAIAVGSRSFTIPFNRQQLADYLNVDRSALSNELSKMRREGLLETERNHFVLRVDSGDYAP